MRREMPEAERRLWLRLRCDQLGFRFRRQHRFPPYVVDFYCSELKLVVEVDGPQHRDRLTAQYDDERTNALRERGIEILRIPNELLIRDARMVEQCIRAAIESRR